MCSGSAPERKLLPTTRLAPGYNTWAPERIRFGVNVIHHRIVHACFLIIGMASREPVRSCQDVTSTAVLLCHLDPGLPCTWKGVRNVPAKKQLHVVPAFDMADCQADHNSAAFCQRPNHATIIRLPVVLPWVFCPTPECCMELAHEDWKYSHYHPRIDVSNRPWSVR